MNGALPFLWAQRSGIESLLFRVRCPCGINQPADLTAIESDHPPSSDAIDGAQFIPGTMLAGRYRIVGLLGRLKFLPEAFIGDIDATFWREP